MKQNPKNERIVNQQDDYNIDQKSGTVSGESERKKNPNQQSKLTFDDLKGKKVDGDPAIESDKPITQDN